jgi:hypothetical protein
MKKVIAILSATTFVQNALDENTDLSAFKEKPSLKVIIGVLAICFSYIIGWPLIAFFSFLSIYLDQPIVIIIGGPTAYVFSHIVFIWGMYLAGARYSWIFLRWLTRIAMLKLLKRYPVADPKTNTHSTI